MRITLINQSAKATILPERGGLLTSLVLPGKHNERELLFLPDDFSENDSGWPGGGAPIMFPFAGRTFHDERPFFYELGGTVYNMPLHGFSWAKPWTIKSSSETELLITQEDGPGTRELYPFAWRQEAQYSLHERFLEITYSVTNLGCLLSQKESMPLAIGLHPYFRIDSAPGQTALLCQASELFQVTPSGAAGKKSPHQPAKQEPLLSDPIYRNLILAGLSTNEAGYKDLKTGHEVRISWQEPSSIQNIVLWRKDDQPFHCIEPWMGLPDAVSNGSGLRRLAKGEAFTLTFKIATES